MAGAQLRLLPHKGQLETARSGLAGGGLHLGGAMAGDHGGAARLQVDRLVQHVVQQRAPAQALQHLGKAAFHARALAGRHDEDVELRHGNGKLGLRTPWRAGTGIIGCAAPGLGPYNRGSRRGCLS